jgi:hypothetical protein
MVGVRLQFWCRYSVALQSCLALGFGVSSPLCQLLNPESLSDLRKRRTAQRIHYILPSFSKTGEGELLFSETVATQLLIPLSRFPVILLVVVASTMPVYVLTFVWSQQVSSIYTTNPTRVGLSNFPTGFGTEIGVLFAALFMKRLGRTNLQLAAACLVLTIFVGLQATLTENSMRPALGYLSIAGLAIGYIEVASVVMAQLVVPDEYIGDATGLLITLRTIGAAIGSKSF